MGDPPAGRHPLRVCYHPGLFMLLRRAVTWKAVGLTAAAASAAARNRSSCAGGSRPRQGGICKPTALSRQESQECRYELPATGCSGRTDLPPRDPGRHKQAWTTDPTHEHADGSGQVDESEDVPPTTGIWNISTLSTRQGWHRYIHRHAGSTDDKGACKKEPQDETPSQAGQPSEPGGGEGPRRRDSRIRMDRQGKDRMRRKACHSPWHLHGAGALGTEWWH